MLQTQPALRKIKGVEPVHHTQTEALARQVEGALVHRFDGLDINCRWCLERLEFLP